MVDASGITSGGGELLIDVRCHCDLDIPLFLNIGVRDHPEGHDVRSDWL